MLSVNRAANTSAPSSYRSFSCSVFTAITPDPCETQRPFRVSCLAKKLHWLLHSTHMSTTTVYLGADHAGFALKQQIKEKLLQDGHEIYDLSPTFKAGDDYPQIARAVAQQVARDPQSRGVLACGSGIGVTIAANRIKGIRAFDALDAELTTLARQHTDANVIAFSGWRLKLADAEKLLDIFFNTRFSPAERHHRRVDQLK